MAFKYLISTVHHQGPKGQTGGALDLNMSPAQSQDTPAVVLSSSSAGGSKGANSRSQPHDDASSALR